MRILFKSIACLLMFVGALTAQSDSASTFLLPEMKISQKENGKKITFEFEKDKNRLSLKGSEISLKWYNEMHSVNIKDLKIIKFRDGSYFGQGALGGLLAGVAIASLIFFTSKDDNSNSQGHPNISIPKGAVFILVLPCTLLGMLFGGLTPHYEEYNFTKIPDDKKLKLLHKAINENIIE